MWREILAMHSPGPTVRAPLHTTAASLAPTRSPAATAQRSGISEDAPVQSIAASAAIARSSSPLSVLRTLAFSSFRVARPEGLNRCSAQRAGHDDIASAQSVAASVPLSACIGTATSFSANARAASVTDSSPR